MATIATKSCLARFATCSTLPKMTSFAKSTKQTRVQVNMNKRFVFILINTWYNLLNFFKCANYSGNLPRLLFRETIIVYILFLLL